MPFTASRSDRCQFALDVVCGMEYLHAFLPHPILHRDLKSGNVMLWKNQVSVCFNMLVLELQSITLFIMFLCF